MTDSDKKEMIMDRLHGHVDANPEEERQNLISSNVCKCVDGECSPQCAC